MRLPVLHINTEVGTAVFNTQSLDPDYQPVLLRF